MPFKTTSCIVETNFCLEHRYGNVLVSSLQAGLTVPFIKNLLLSLDT